MSQKSLIYSFVARGTTVLAEYSEFTGNIPDIATQCLQRLPSTTDNFIYNCDKHCFNFHIHNGYVYCVVAKENVNNQISIAFLEHLKEDFMERYGGGKANTTTAKSLNKEFGPIIKEHMQYIIDHADEIEKLVKVKNQVSEVQSIMLGNIVEAMDRGKNLTVLSHKAQDLRDTAHEFKQNGEQIRWKMWFQNLKIKLVVIGIILVLVLILWLSICGGFDCSN